jgi:hypothetical protein
MKIIVTHNSPDIDNVTSTWLIKRFLNGWQEAEHRFVPAGTRMQGSRLEAPSGEGDPIEKIGENEVITVDTGLGPLDHHQTKSNEVCAATLTWDYVRNNGQMFDHDEESGKVQDREQAISRIVNLALDDDHFKQVFYPEPNADYLEATLAELIEGAKLVKPDDDMYVMNFGMQGLDLLLRKMENKIWAERELKENGTEFESHWGKAIALETINDDVIKVGQKDGYAVIVRRDPRKGYVRIKASPAVDVDLTIAYEQLKKMDPDATWFLHVGKKMLLNGTTKNPKMRPTKLSLSDIIAVLKK